MLQHIQLLRNIGSFDSITPGAAVPFDGFTLIYAENGRGKTTLAALVRSLASGDPSLVLHRHRLGAAHPPHAILAVTGSGAHSFQNGAWSAPLPNIAVFDDTFVADNVCSGIEIETGHRQKLHELILGSQGVALNAELQRHVAAVEEHNRNIRTREDAISAAAKGGFTTDQFCALAEDAQIDTKIQESERGLAAARESERVAARPGFQLFRLPDFGVDELNALLARDLPALEIGATKKVQEHLGTLGEGGERWVAEGMNIVERSGHSPAKSNCPFCAQPLSASPVIEHYRAYFSAEYTALKDEIANASRTLTRQHGGEVQAAFERDVRVAIENREFWSRFAEMPPIAVDTAAVALLWKEARDAVSDLLAQKQASPLERLAVPEAVRLKIKAYREARDQVAAVAEPLTAANHAIELVKERARNANAATLAADLEKRKAVKRRFTPDVAARCDAYLAAKAAKAATETARDKAREDLDAYRRNIFPTYQRAMNEYLARFGAGFRLSDVTSVNTRAGSSATYSVVINNQAVGLSNDNGPSFRNTLSSGDRNALALAFFFASLEQDPHLADKIVIIDDPMTSLDDHRTLVTVEEIIKMTRRVKQMIVLSHAKPFLMSLWKSGPKNARAAMRIGRAQNGSDIAVWQVSQDSVTEHDRRYARVLTYLRAADPAMERTVASDLRPMLEAWGRVAYPADFPPEELLGGFINRCEQAVGTAQQIMKQADIDELKGLTNFANLFHHDTNPTYETEHINDQQLAQYASRTLAFIGKA